MRHSFAHLLRLLALASLLSGAFGFRGATAVQAAAVHVHTVEPGETLRSIADLYGVSPRTVLAANSIDDADVLHVGQQLTVPSVDGVLHTVADGETLGGIATTFGVSTSDLISANALDDAPDLVRVGTVLVVPGVNPETVTPSQRTATVSAPE